MNPAKSPELHDRNDGTGWWSVTIDGYVTYCGSEIQCRRRFAILTQPVSRAGRLVWRTRPAFSSV